VPRITVMAGLGVHGYALVIAGLRSLVAKR
jgi:hypothetical protein